MTEIFDPFISHPGFTYSGSTRAVYPLSKKNSKKDVPSTVIRPNYAREGVSNTLAYWWQASPLKSIHNHPFETVVLTMIYHLI